MRLQKERLEGLCRALQSQLRGSVDNVKQRQETQGDNQEESSISDTSRQGQEIQDKAQEEESAADVVSHESQGT